MADSSCCKGAVGSFAVRLNHRLQFDQGGSLRPRGSRLRAWKGTLGGDSDWGGPSQCIKLHPSKSDHRRTSGGVAGPGVLTEAAVLLVSSRSNSDLDGPPVVAV